MTIKFVKVPASKIGVGARQVKGLESHGLFYFVRLELDTIGAQCATCNTIIWLDSNEDPVLSETRPASVPASGPEYRQYYVDKIKRFLKSLPACPICNEINYNLMITILSYTRFPDGTSFDVRSSQVSLDCDVTDENEVWWLQK